MHSLRISLLSALLLTLAVAPLAFADNDENENSGKKGRGEEKKFLHFAMPFSVIGTTTASLQAQISSLQELLKSFKAQREALDDDNATSTKAMRDALKESMKDTKSELKSAEKQLRFSRALTRGMSGDDVRDLQELLAQDSDILSSDSITGFFGPKTENAMRKFQKKHGIESIGVFGPKSQAKILALFVGRELPPGIIKRLGLEMSSTTPGQGFVTLCHVTGSATAKQTLVIAIPALGAHLAHGDSVGVCAGSGTGTTTPPTADTTKPVISGVSVSAISSTTATLAWTTNENAVSKIYFATSSPLNPATAWTKGTASSTMTHMHTIMGLTPATTYYFVLESKDASNNSATTSQSSFLTL